MQTKKKAIRKAPKKTIADKVLAAIERYGEATTDRLARRIGEDGKSVSSACSRLCKRGLLRRTDTTARGRGGEAVWALPKAGVRGSIAAVSRLREGPGKSVRGFNENEHPALSRGKGSRGRK